MESPLRPPELVPIQCPWPPWPVSSSYNGAFVSGVRALILRARDPQGALSSVHAMMLSPVAQH